MLGVHIINTAPKTSCVFSPAIFEVLVAVLSALSWKNNNGDIKLYTDKKVFNFMRKHDLVDVWSEIIVTDFEILKNINNKVFWAAGKFHAIENEKPPFFVIDTDFIVWNTIECELLKNKIITIHDEPIGNAVYPPKEKLNLTQAQGKLLDELNWNINASNTAFMYFNDMNFKNTYLKLALNFMEQHNPNNSDQLIYMVLVEQRLFSMVADLLKINIHYLLNQNNIGIQKNYTHLWGLKQKLKNNYIMKKNFESMCIKRINQEYPQYLTRIKKMMLTLDGEENER